ncbi:DUF7173 family protein [Variovorax sp. GT1P44]|uniref:DUF7173 family protein n=1 Tax=Variovorax sp. GT1P44 TaxID=3443742 RepID=UPI003F48BDD5
MSPDIQSLIDALRVAKSAESEAKDNRLAIEEQILALFPTPDGGEGTEKEGDLSIAWKLTRKVDTDPLQDAWVELTPNTQKVFRWKADVDLKQLRALQELDATAYTAASKFITTTPAKPSLTLKESA